MAVDPRQAVAQGHGRAALDRADDPGCTPDRRVDGCPSVREGRRLDSADNGNGRCLDRSDDQLSRHSGDGRSNGGQDGEATRPRSFSRMASERSPVDGAQTVRTSWRTGLDRRSERFAGRSPDCRVMARSNPHAQPNGCRHGARTDREGGGRAVIGTVGAARTRSRQIASVSPRWGLSSN